MARTGTWEWALAQVLAAKLREIHLHPFKLDGEPTVTTSRYPHLKRERVVIEFDIVPE
jgi:hypothetical protein